MTYVQFGQPCPQDMRPAAAEPMPEEYRPKKVMKAEIDDAGVRVTLACGHVIWTALSVDSMHWTTIGLDSGTGARVRLGHMYCGACLDELLASVKGGAQ
jgi:hypothetical protein